MVINDHMMSLETTAIRKKHSVCHTMWCMTLSFMSALPMPNYVFVALWSNSRPYRVAILGYDVIGNTVGFW